MSTAPKAPIQTKKHLARQQREQRAQRAVIITTIVVIALAVLMVAYGLLKSSLFDARQTVASVAGEKITTGEWQSQTRFQRGSVINNAIQNYQYAQIFPDPSFQAQFASQLAQMKMQLEPNILGRQVIDTMVDDLVVRQEAEKRGITVSEAEIDSSFEGVFGYYPDGTPTPEPTLAAIPTSTLSPLQLTLTAPTATPLATEVITPTAEVTAAAVLTPTATSEPTFTPFPIPTEVANPTATPEPTATPDTLEEFGNYTNTIEQFNTNFGLPEKVFTRILRELLVGQMLREKLKDSVLAEQEIARSEPQVWARHILVADEALAVAISEKIKAGEDFCQQAAEFSTDTSNKDACGDLGWFGTGRMVKEFDDAAFALQPGELSQPIKTSFGYHIIQSLGKEERPIDEGVYNSTRESKFTEWLNNIKQEYEIVIKDDLILARVISDPTWPPVLDDFIAQIQGQSVQPELSIPTAVP